MGSRRHYARSEGDPDEIDLGDDEAAFIAQRDGFYLSSVSETAWPYVQHRGGPRRIPTPRFSEAEVETATEPLRRKHAQLEADLSNCRNRLPDLK